MPKLSVIMPVFNAGDPLRKAVYSVLAWMPKDAELITLDDGSSDGSLQLLRELAQNDRRLKVMANEVNIGVARSLNRLLDNCDSPLVARMDADDIDLPWRYLTEIQGLAFHRADLVFATVVHYAPEHHKLWPQLPYGIDDDVAPLMLLLGNPFVHSSMLADTSVLRAIGGYRNVPSEDYDLWMRLVLAGRRIRRLPVHALIYRHHARQVTSNADWALSARSNPMTADVHAELAYHLIRWKGPVFAAQRGPLATGRDIHDLSAFLTQVSGRAAELGLGKSRALRREIGRQAARLSAARRHLFP
jgi:glycosyltransferase involved in cell wall biosynthesis